MQGLPEDYYTKNHFSLIHLGCKQSATAGITFQDTWTLWPYFHKIMKKVQEKRNPTLPVFAMAYALTFDEPEKLAPSQMLKLAQRLYVLFFYLIIKSITTSLNLS